MNTTLFYDKLSDLSSWRKKELSTLILEIQKEHNENLELIINRSSIVLSYAHWQKHIEESLILYIDLLNELKININESIPENLIKTSFWGRLSKKFDLSKNDFDFLFSQFKNSEKVINLQQNILVFKPNFTFTELKENIHNLALAEISPEKIKAVNNAEQGFKVLINRRSKIAHGENDTPKVEDCLTLIKLVLDFIDSLNELLVDTAISLHNLNSQDQI